ncbi:uncharacterized protein PRCAT00002734001 [Priceomyces carsonii]|uniref:uncharacterized protein n=1 Tax=Priceomyces carsonii TaxID=28549 RepID=UPI002ED7BE72|nr:unnamed protein product [Priceomyces carsonii]
MFNLKELVRPNILTLEPYRCARDDFKVGILLDANENTYGPALSSLTEDQKSLELNRYPDPHQVDLKKQIVQFRNSNASEYLNDYDKFKLTTDNLCLGVGSDESIDMLLRCICVPGRDKMLTCPPTYGMYSICATVNDVGISQVPLVYPSFQIDREAIIEKLSNDNAIKILYLTSPGNPTAKLINPKDVVLLLEKLSKIWNGLVVVDEAYIDFASLDEKGRSKSVCTLVNQYQNLVVLQTLSKSFGLAGIRLGITYCSTQLSFHLNSMKYPYNISSLTSSIAIKATHSNDGLKKMKEYVNTIVEQRQIVLEKLQELRGIGRNIGGLDANFLLLEVLDKSGTPSNDIAYQLYQKLAIENQVVVRFRGKELNCTGALRISIGTAEENELLVRKFEKCLNEILS